MRLISTVILSRILSPGDFGAIGVLLALTTAFNLMSDAGFQAFVIRHAHAERRPFLNTVWTLRLIRSLLLCAIFWLAAPFVALAIDKPELTNLLQAGALLFLLDALPSLALYMAVRHRHLIRLSIVEITALAVQIIVAVVMAWWLQNYWAIVIAMVVAGMLRTMLSFAAFEYCGVGLHFDRHVAADLLNFAKFIAPSSMITLILMQSDRLVLSRLFSLDLLGVYIIALSLGETIRGLTDSIGNRVIYPRLAEQFRMDSRLMIVRVAQERRLLSPLLSLLAGGLVGLAPVVVAILYDTRYQSAAFYLQLFAPNLLLYFLNASAAQWLVAEGRPRLVLQANMARLIWVAVASPIAYLAVGAVGIIAVFGSMEIWAAVRLLHGLGWPQQFIRQEFQSLGVGFVGVLAGSLISFLASPFLL